MSSTNSESCKCEPCPIDLDELGFRTEWEDQLFVGKHCLWHKHIRGDYGCISPDIENGEACLFVQFTKDRFFICAVYADDWKETRHVSKVVFDEESKRWFVVMEDAFFTVPVSELRQWAKLLGAKRK